MGVKQIKENMEYPKFFRKAIRGNVGGTKLNKRGDPEDFLLKGDPNSSLTDQDDITLEINSEEDEKYLIKKNKSTIVKGYLVEVGDYQLSLDTTNSVTDGYLKDLLKKPFGAMRKRVDAFTSPVPLYRLLEYAVKDNKPIKTVEYIKTKLHEVEGVSVIPLRTEGESGVVAGNI